MKLYHGTANRNIEYFDIKKSEPDNDFGEGIYFTTKFFQAQKWATRNGEGAVYEIDVDLEKLKYRILEYKDNDENFYELCYLCINKTKDVAIENIPNFKNCDIICGRMVSNYDDFVECIKIFHGDENYRSSVVYKKTGEINTFEELKSKIKLWDKYDQYCFKESAIEIIHKNLTKVFYVEKDKSNPVSEYLLKFDKKSKKIKKI